MRTLYKKKYGILIKNDIEIQGIREASKLAATILDKLCQKAKEGVTTNELDLLCRKLHEEAGARPAPLGYGKPPYPKVSALRLTKLSATAFPMTFLLKKAILSISMLPVFLTDTMATAAAW